jgi:hypothetical protein
MRWKLAALLGLLHLALSFLLVLYAFNRGMERFDTGSAPGPGLKVLERVGVVLTSPGRWISDRLSPGRLRDALEWPLFIANSALWGWAGSVAYTRWKSSGRHG